MKISFKNSYFILLFLMIVNSQVIAQQNYDLSGIHSYKKKEMSWGAIYQAGKEREELFTDISKQIDEVSIGDVKFQFSSRNWTFLDFKQEQLELNVEAGPLWGSGNWTDSNYVHNITADHTIAGFRINGSIVYASRFYYSDNNFTLVQISTDARYDLFRKHSMGTLIDSNGVSNDYNVKSNLTKFRYGFATRAGWGTGRLNPVNHQMVADYIFDKYYKGRTFSKEETDKVLMEIEAIKNGRSIIAGHDIDKESAQIADFLNHHMYLTRPLKLEQDWKYGEFLPRFSGSRLEVGPFFTYYNREPDFVYGGYIQYNNEKYRNYKWNRKFNVGANYNWYKKKDFMMAEIELGWSYYMKLKSQFDFGLKYIPGVTLNSLDNIGKVNHGFIPYIGYYSQINEITRFKFALAMRISNNEEIMLPGPEIYVSIYRSKY